MQIFARWPIGLTFFCALLPLRYVAPWLSDFWRSIVNSVSIALWRICPTTVSLFLKSEPIEMDQKFNFYDKGTVVWKFLKASRASRSKKLHQKEILWRQKCLTKVLFSARGRGFYFITQWKFFWFFFRSSALLRHIFIFCHILLTSSWSLL